MRFDQPDLRILRRMQTAIQRPAMENLHRLLQLLAGSGGDRRQDPLYARRTFPGNAELRGGGRYRETYRRARPGASLRSSMGGSRQRNQRLGRE